MCKQLLHTSELEASPWVGCLGVGSQYQHSVALGGTHRAPSRESAFLPDDFTTLQLPCVGLTMNSATNLMTSQHCRCLVVGLTMKSATKPDGAFSGVRLLTRRH
jgi:hypothetical protein